MILGWFLMLLPLIAIWGAICVVEESLKFGTQLFVVMVIAIAAIGLMVNGALYGAALVFGS